MERSSETTRERLIAAAEQLFAQEGVATTSLREVNRAAGARNANAVQYHFQDRSGLLGAVIDKHRPDVEARRHALLDQIEADGAHDLRAMVAALVRPPAAKLDDLDGGRYYLQIWSELVNRPRPPIDQGALDDLRSSITRWRSLVTPLIDTEAARVHHRFTAIRFSATELGRRARSGPHTDDRLFVSHLIDLVTAILAAPVSPETTRLADARDVARAGAPAPR